ncbi:MAG: NADH-quinone oxidoreductase subunit M [Candidatus Methylomirabilota bacterium]|nr:NADH-quinone oxidoreductase subunit M [candidate division NC10 bacterium]PWB46345.1 MAG: NADH-quinone oxidoreductase subunit M [candidate division NC10 bacterium]
MILAWVIAIVLSGGLLAWSLERMGPHWPRWISVAALVIDLVLALTMWWMGYVGLTKMEHSGGWLAEADWDWIPRFGIRFHLAADGLSLLLVLLTLFLGIASVGASWTEVKERVGFFHFNLMWVLGGVLGVFLALDLFLFYFFWEMMLVPMYFLIGIWGHENRVYAAIKFFLFTQASGLLMLVAIVSLYFVHHASTGVYTFDYFRLLGTPLQSSTGMWMMLGFFIAFAVKLPAVPFHTWLPDAHTEAPTAGSVILAGLLLKTGAYGLMRFVVPLFPEAAHAFAPMGMALGVIGILYGAVMAFAQTDLKRLVAYTSVSHLGFVLIGVFAWNELALQGAIMQMICHGISTGALFILVGALAERIHTRDIRRMGGLWSVVPRMAGVGMIFALASLGLPGLGNFVAEFLVLLGAYRANIILAAIATVGLVTATIYSLSLVQRTFHGPNTAGWAPPDFSIREMAVMAAMIAAIVWLGLYPQPVLATARPTLTGLQQYAVQGLHLREDIP